MTGAELEKELYHYGVSLLSRREHSEQELQQKLYRKRNKPAKSSDPSFGLSSDFSSEPDLVAASVFDEAVAQTLDRLKRQNYLSNTRYAQMLLRSRFARGYGPSRVKLELQAAGLDNELITLSFEEFEADWFESALRMRAKRFGLGSLKEESKLKFKQMRFLASRGFHQEHITYALEAETEL